MEPGRRGRDPGTGAMEEAGGGGCGGLLRWGRGLRGLVRCEEEASEKMWD